MQILRIGTKSVGLHGFHDYCLTNAIDPVTLKQLIESKFSCNSNWIDGGLRVNVNKDKISEALIDELVKLEETQRELTETVVHQIETVREKTPQTDDQFQIMSLYLKLYLKWSLTYEQNPQIIFDIQNAYENKDLSTLIRLSEISRL